MNSVILKMWFGTFLSLLSSLVPTWLSHEHMVLSRPPLVTVAAAVPVKKALPKMQPAGAAMTAHSTIFCELSGQAIYQGLPYGHADIDFWITSATGQEMRRIKTNADGTYQVSFMMEANAKEPLDWELKAQTQDLKTLHRAGRRIIRDQESKIAIRNILEFVAD